ncbi:MAG: hypothetical protein PW843_27985 [Azospirillaceae bacterium]|nr:hypothetical protein [Azospirillaceae bacterium]
MININDYISKYKISDEDRKKLENSTTDPIVYHIWKENKERKECVYSEIGPIIFRYMDIRTEAPIRSGSYWTQALIEDSEYAGYTIGIFSVQAKWRIELKLSADEWISNFDHGECRQGLIREFTNIYPIPQNRINWFKMNDEIIS